LSTLSCGNMTKLQQFRFISWGQTLVAGNFCVPKAAL
jgi:hypothetical protein